MDEVGDATDCWVCTDAFTDPRILSCGHTFCLRCLTEIQKTTITSPKEALSCPFCRQTFTVPKDGLAALPKNYSLTKLIEASRPSDPCDQHRSRSLEMYCVDCGSVVCVRCLGDGHQLHQCCSIEKAAEVYRRMMQEYALRFSGFASSVRSERRVTTDRSTATLMSIERADVRVRERAKQLKQLIDRQAMSLLYELDHQRQAAWVDVQGEFERFVEHIEELERFRKFCSEAEKYSSVELCRNVGQLESMAEELWSRHHARIAEYVAGRGQPTETVFKDACIEEILNSERNNIVGRIEAVVNQPLKRVKVTQNYESRLEDELTLQCGDVIDVIKQNDPERWQGILNGKIGFFPVNFVEVIDQLSEDQSVQLGRVLHSYTAQTEDELDLLEGDTVTVLCNESSSCGEGWMVGVIGGKMGMIPGNCVEIMETKSAEKVAEFAEVSTHKETSAVTPLTNIGLNPQNGLVVRPHVPDSENTDELRLCIGDVIRVLYQDSPYEGWWTGETDDSIGVFPWNCVQLLPPGNENPPKPSDCPPTSTATPEEAGYTSDTTTAAASRPPFAMDDIVKNNENNEICIGQLKDNGQPRDNGQHTDNRQPEENNGQRTTVMNQPQSPEIIAQKPKEDNYSCEDLQVAKTKNEAKSRPTHMEDEEAVVKSNPIETISSDASECSREKLRSKRNKLNTDSGPTGRQHLPHLSAATDVEFRSIRSQHPPPPLPTPSSSDELSNATSESNATSGAVKHRRSPGRGTNLRANVVFDYSRQHEDELNLRVGDIITVLRQNLTDEGWWKGELNGKVGIFPENFVKLLGRNSANVGRSCASPVLRGTDSRKGSTTSEVNRRTFNVRIFTDDPQILRLSKGLITSSGNSSLVNSCD